LEAIIEKTEPKQAFFREIPDALEPDIVLATNTSSIPITRLAAGLPQPERLVGMHFFNPAPVMKLVEIISGIATLPELAKSVKTLAESWGKIAVEAKDSPGFIVNRVARLYYLEAQKMVEEGVTDFETLDQLAESFGFKMGPFRLMDLIGVDTNYSVTCSMFESFHFEERFRPMRLQQQLVEAGFNGKKSGKGFYGYAQGKKVDD
jgi:3-hydroxybutyryl-CoA dehydrogenase